MDDYFPADRETTVTHVSIYVPWWWTVAIGVGVLAIVAAIVWL